MRGKLAHNGRYNDVSEFQWWGRHEEFHGAGGGTDIAGPARDLAIDCARLVCLALVVVGHCMMTSPVLHPDGTVTTENTLAEQDWFEPVIWVFMVMPLFFVAGGITGVQSWRRMQARGGSGFEFVQSRLLRLVRPAAALLAVMFVGLWGALLAGVDPQVVQLLASGAGMPLWFLAAYLAAQLNIPLLVGLHRRAPWLTLLGLVALVVTVDCFRGAFPTLAYINMVFVWCAAQQLGFFMADGWLDRWSRSQLVGLIAASNLLMLVLVVLGLYRDNMLVNLNPPNLSLFLLGISQAAVLQLSRPLLNALAEVRWIRAVMVVVGRHAMTVYLWHLPLLAAMTGLLLLTDFPNPPRAARDGGGHARSSSSEWSSSCCRRSSCSGGLRNGRRRPCTHAAGRRPPW